LGKKSSLDFNDALNADCIWNGEDISCLEMEADGRHIVSREMD